MSHDLAVVKPLGTTRSNASARNASALRNAVGQYAGSAAGTPPRSAGRLRGGRSAMPITPSGHHAPRATRIARKGGPVRGGQSL
jgi:hypothetical protein